MRLIVTRQRFFRARGLNWICWRVSVVDFVPGATINKIIFAVIGQKISNLAVAGLIDKLFGHRLAQ
jgi:hypothetical protein